MLFEEGDLMIFVLELLFHALDLALFEDGGLRCAGWHDAAHVGVVIYVRLNAFWGYSIIVYLNVLFLVN